MSSKYLILLQFKLMRVQKTLGVDGVTGKVKGLFFRCKLSECFGCQ